MVSCSSNKMNPKMQKKNRKKINFWSNTLRKNGLRKKIAKFFFCPFLPILDAAAKFLLIINSKHPTQKLGFRETLESGRYVVACTVVGLVAHIGVLAEGVSRGLLCNPGAGGGRFHKGEMGCSAA